MANVKLTVKDNAIQKGTYGGNRYVKFVAIDGVLAMDMVTNGLANFIYFTKNDVAVLKKIS